MSTLFIQTNTPLDIREIFTLGLTSKQGADKIGHKGSGLKFTLAMLHRMGTALEIETPDFHIISSTVKDTIKDKEHEFIVLLDILNNKIIDTNITTFAGIDTWDQPWFVIREMLQNALDEDGAFGLEKLDGYTTTCSIVLTPELEEAYNNRAEWYQPRNPGIISQGNSFFYHGFKIYTDEKFKYSYDLTTILKRESLSEDRQLRNFKAYEVYHQVIQKAVFNNDIYQNMIECNSNDMIELCYGAYIACNHEKKSFKENNKEGFDLDRLVEVMTEMHGNNLAYTTGDIDTVMKYYCDALGVTPVKVHPNMAYLLQYSDKIKKIADIVPEMGQRLRKAANVPLSLTAKLKKVARMVKPWAKNPDGTPMQITIEIVEKVCEDDTINVKAMAHMGKGKISIMKASLEKDSIEEVFQTLIHEVAHLRCGEGDCTPEFERELGKMIWEGRYGRKGTINIE